LFLRPSGDNPPFMRHVIVNRFPTSALHQSALLATDVHY